MVIVNFWLMLSPAARDALSGAAQVGPLLETQGPQPPPPVINSLTFPRLNVLRPDTLKLVRNFPERHHDHFPPGIWNCYARGEGYSDFVGMREELQELEERHYPDFQVAGCWNYYTGDPIGGVGSPWFITPPELKDIIPGGIQDIVLGAGQATRKFV